MFSVAVKGYGIVIWDGDGEWRTYSASDSLSATLTARVEFALESVAVPAAEIDVREALLSLTGAGLLSADCEHGPGECDGEPTLS
jgi:hypothetical protein